MRASAVSRAGAESGNPAHDAYLRKIGAVHIDMVIANLYPFAAMSRKGIEEARGHMDIGGVTMTYAAAKNFLKVAVVTDRKDYAKIAAALAKQKGMLPLGMRAALAKKGLRHVSSYLGGIDRYFGKLKEADIRGAYL